MIIIYFFAIVIGLYLLAIVTPVPIAVRSRALAWFLVYPLMRTLYWTVAFIAGAIFLLPFGEWVLWADIVDGFREDVDNSWARYVKNWRELVTGVETRTWPGR